MVFVDADARARIRDDLGTTLIVEAAAGTGKTTELVHRMISVLASGTDIRRLVAVTFTDKAAGELKLRLRAGLEAARVGATGDRHAQILVALARLEEAHIHTIHGFCGELLRARPVEAKVDPLFRPLNEDEASRLFRDAFDAWFEVARSNPPEGVRRVFRRMGVRAKDAIERAARTLSDLRAYGARYQRRSFDREGEALRLGAELQAFASHTATPAWVRDPFFLDTEVARAAAGRIARAMEAASPNVDSIEAELVHLAKNRDFGRKKGTAAQFAPGLARSDLLSEFDALHACLVRFELSASGDLASLLRDELDVVVRRYEQEKAAIGALDFDDLLLRARDMLRDDAGARGEFQGRFDRIFVDEFQDTDFVQADILLALGADPTTNRPRPGKLFLVGDPKQAIYRFRRADPAVYERVKRELVASGAAALTLSTSFRSVPAIQRFVDAAFEPVMRFDAEAQQAEYVPLAGARAGDARVAAVMALPIHGTLGSYGVVKSRVLASTPRAVAECVRWLVEQSGFTVTEADRPLERVRLQARHVCLLFRSLQAFGEDRTQPFAEALDAHGIAHIRVGGRALGSREEVEAMLLALEAVDRPDDRLAVVAALSGTLFAIADEALVEYAHLFGSPSPRTLPKGPMPAHLEPVRDALAILAELHSLRARRPVADTLWALFRATRAHAGFALWANGEHALPNALTLVDIARTREARDGVRLSAFIDGVRQEFVSGRGPEASIFEEGADGVRMMTVHKSKGLEFPVVILVDPSTEVRDSVSRYVDAERGLAAIELCGAAPWELVENRDAEAARERAESVRVAYVAATRARDLLIVPIVAEEPRFPTKSWAAPLLAAVNDVLSRRRLANASASLGAAHDGLSDLARRYATEDGRELLLWDASAAEVGRSPLVGLRREDWLRAGTPHAEAGRAAYEAFVIERGELMVRAAERDQKKVTATARASGSEAPVEEAIVLMETVRASSRPGGARFGTLVHAVLASVALDADAASVRQLAAFEGRAAGASAQEIDAAEHAVSTALRHSLFDRARSAYARGACHREVPIAELLPSGELLHGVVDLAFEDGGTWVVVDYKTDAVIDAELDRYRRQVAHYMSAIARATSSPVTGVLFRC